MTTSNSTVSNHKNDTDDKGMHSSYAKFFAMIGTSIVTMFFLMYLHS